MPDMLQVKKETKPGGIREMAGIAMPMVVSFACDTVMTFTDRMFLSRVSPVHMNASMAGGITYFLMLSFFYGLIGYVTALVAQYMGAGQNDKCSKVTVQALLIIAFVYPIIILLRPVIMALVAKLGVSSDEFVLQKQYFEWLSLGACFSLGRHAISCFFSGIGRTRTVMAASLLAMTVNGLLNYGFIFGHFGLPKLGIRGAALGTVLASLSAFLFLVTQYLNKETRKKYAVTDSFVYDRTLMSKLWRFGCPAGFELALNMLAFCGMIYLFHGQGPVVATALTIVFNWDMVTFIPLIGVEVGVTSLVGRYKGAGRLDIAATAVRSGFVLGLGYAVMMLIIFLAFPAQLVDFFRPDVTDKIFLNAQPMAVSMIKLIAVYVAAEVLLLVFSGALRGAGDTFWAMIISVGIHWVILAALYAALVRYHAGAFTAWCLLVGIFTALTVLPYGRYRQGRWKTIRIVEEKH